MPRVINIVHSLADKRGGPSQAIKNLSAGLVNLGYDVDIICGDRNVAHDGSFYSDFQELTGLNITYAPVRLLDAIVCQPEKYLPSKFRPMEPGATVIHLHGLWQVSSIIAYRVAKKFHLPLLISPHGMLEPFALKIKSAKKRAALMLYQKRILQGADCIHVNSEKERLGVDSLGLKPSISVVENGVAISDVSSGPVENKQLFKQLGERRRALFIGRIDPIKGLDNLIRAWSLVDSAGWELVIVGSGEPRYERYLFRLVESLKLSGSVKFLPFATGDIKKALFVSADLFILPSRSESFGIVVGEALGYGLPVLTTTGTPWSTIEEEDFGWLVDPTVDGLVYGLTLALNSSSSSLHKKGLRGARYVRERLSWASISRQMDVLYQSVLT